MKPRQPEPFINIFKSLNAYSKYAHEMFVSIIQIECTLTERLSQEFKWGFFSSSHGRKGHNVEGDVLVLNMKDTEKDRRVKPRQTEAFMDSFQVPQRIQQIFP